MSNEQTARHKITLSIPRATWEAMVELAQQHQRSFTKELIWALQAYIRREQRQEQQQAEQEP